MKVSEEVTKTVILVRETETLQSAFAFVMDSMDVLGGHPTIEISSRQRYDSEDDGKVYFSVKVQSSNVITPQGKS